MYVVLCTVWRMDRWATDLMDGWMDGFLIECSEIYVVCVCVCVYSLPVYHFLA